MVTRRFDIPTNAGRCDCFAAYPEDGRTYPAAILYMDAYGPRPYLYEMAEELASHGYYVLLPNILYRQRRAPVVDVRFPVTPETLPEARAQLMELIGKYNQDEAVADARFLLDFLSKQPQVKPGPVGLTGYCMGGGLALRVAAQYPDRVAAVASFHGGRLATDAPNSPHLFAKSIKARVYLAHAENDASIPAEQIEKLHRALDEAGVKYEGEVYTGAAHGFTMADLPPYNEAALKRHWDKLLALFSATLG